jgi:hypothetical protein
MVLRLLIPLFVVLALVATACSSDGQEITAQNCDEVVDETMELIQRLIDDVDEEFGEMTVEEFIDTGGDLPSIERFTGDAEKINQIGLELGCSQAQIEQDMLNRAGDLTATTDLGRFLITSIRTGGL